MYCRFCGKNIPENSTFCPVCGCALNDDNNTSVRTEPTANFTHSSSSKSNKLVMPIILVVAIVIGAVCFGLGIIGGPDSSNAPQVNLFDDLNIEWVYSATEEEYSLQVSSANPLLNGLNYKTHGADSYGYALIIVEETERSILKQFGVVVADGLFEKDIYVGETPYPIRDVTLAQDDTVRAFADAKLLQQIESCGWNLHSEYGKEKITDYEFYKFHHNSDGLWAIYDIYTDKNEWGYTRYVDISYLFQLPDGTVEDRWIDSGEQIACEVSLSDWD